VGVLVVGLSIIISCKFDNKEHQKVVKTDELITNNLIDVVAKDFIFIAETQIGRYKTFTVE